MQGFHDYEHLQSLFENATEGIILSDGSGKIVLVNPAAVKMFGYKSDEICGQAIEVLVPDQYRPNHRHLREDFYKDPSNRAMGHNRDLYGRRKDGSLLPVEVSLSHYRKDSETFVIAFIVDITRRKEVENNMRQQQAELEKISQEMRQLNAELELKVEERTLILREALQKLEESQVELSEALQKEKQLNEIKSRFVSMASHEFRTPLSSVLSSASLLSRYTGEQDQEKRDRHIGKIKNSVKHLNDILEDFLSLGKLDEGKVATVYTAFNLKEYLEEIVEEMKPFLKGDQEIAFLYSGPENIRLDKKLLKHIVINLLGNAIKFSDEGDEIRLVSAVDDEYIELAVQDEGIGIGAEDQQHIFSSFFRAANAVNIQGTGLGLHIVKRYTDILGGEVSIHSVLNEGTKVQLKIPVQQDES